jgi:hypothetical protein
MIRDGARRRLAEIPAVYRVSRSETNAGGQENRRAWRQALREPVFQDANQFAVRRRGMQ